MALSELDPRPFLDTSALGREVELHENLPSTNDRARALAVGGAAHGTCVVSAAQTQGRGRRGRTWWSSPGAGLYASFVLRPRVRPPSAPLITLAAAVAVHEAIEQTCGVVTGIKWPNDILSIPDRKKLVGILLETASFEKRLDHAVVGIGVNLREVERPPEIADLATSIEALAGTAVEPARLLAAIANALEPRIADTSLTDPAGMLARWTDLALGIGEPVTLRNDDEAQHGTMRGITKGGALRLQTEGGEVQTVHVGELRFGHV